MNLTHPDDWEALEDQHLELSTLLDPETNAEICCQLGLDIPSLTAWYTMIHSENSMIEETNNTTTETITTVDTLFDGARTQSSKYTGDISHAYLVGYYESLIRRLAQIPQVQTILNQL
jgi:hypothetical protein